MPGSQAEYQPGTLVDWHAALVEHLLERFNVHDIANDAPPEMQLNRLQQEFEAQGVPLSLPVTEDDGGPNGYRLMHCDELFRAKLPENGTGRELSLYVATFDDHFWLAPRLTDDQARRQKSGFYASVTRGQWYGRADAAVSWAVRTSGFDIDSVLLTVPERSRSGQLGWMPETFGSQPAECLWEMGFSVDPAVSGRLLAVMNGLFLSEPGQEDESWFLPRRFAATGPMLAVWRDPPTPPQHAFSSSMIVLLSVDDPPSQELAQQMTRLAARRGVRLVVVFATGRWSSGQVTAADLEATLEAALAEAPEARCLVVHHGVAFDASTAAYQSALSAFRRRHPTLLLATEALRPGAAGEIDGIAFDQPTESDFVLGFLTL